MMVSSKFSRHAHAFRVPHICKKPLPHGGEEPSGDPDPADPLTNSYDVDVTFLFFHFIFSGELTLNKQFPHHWQSHDEVPEYGEAASFQWFPDTHEFSAWLAHYSAGVQYVTLVADHLPHPDEPNFDTGDFEYSSPIWAGLKAGRIYNP